MSSTTLYGELSRAQKRVVLLKTLPRSIPNISAAMAAKSDWGSSHEAHVRNNPKRTTEFYTESAKDLVKFDPAGVEAMVNGGYMAICESDR